MISGLGMMFEVIVVCIILLLFVLVVFCVNFVKFIEFVNLKLICCCVEIILFVLSNLKWMIDCVGKLFLLGGSVIIGFEILRNCIDWIVDILIGIIVDVVKFLLFVLIVILIILLIE